MKKSANTKLFHQKINFKDVCSKINYFSLVTLLFLTGMFMPELTYSQRLSYDYFFDLSNDPTASTNPFDLSSEDTQPRDIAFNSDGTRMFIVGSANDKVFQYDLSTPFDITTAQYNNENLDVSGQESTPQGITFNNTGSKMYMVGIEKDSVYQYDLATEFDVTTASINDTLDVSNEELTPSSIIFNNDGTKMYITGFSGNNVNQYNLSSAYDLSTATFSNNFDLSNEDTSPRGIAFSSDGKRMFIAGSANDSIYQYDLSTAFDITSATYIKGLDVSNEEGGPQGVVFNSNGSKMFVVGSGGDEVNQYDLNLTNEFTETAANDGSVDGSMTIFIYGETFTNAGSTLTENTNYTIDNIPTGLTPVLTVAGDGASATLTFDGNATNQNESDGVDNLEFTFENSAFDGGDASVVENAINASVSVNIDFFNPQLSFNPSLDISEGATFSGNRGIGGQALYPNAIDFTPDGKTMFTLDDNFNNIDVWNLENPFDISSGVTYSGSSAVPGANNKQLNPKGICFNNDGSKLYVTGFDQKINQYSLSTPYQVTSGVSHDGGISTSSWEKFPMDIAINDVGTKLFIVGLDKKKIHQFSLTTANDITDGISHDGVFDFTNQTSSSTDLFFSENGTKLLIVDEAVFQYSLSTPFDITSGVEYDEVFVDISGAEPFATGMSVSPDNTRIFIIGYGGPNGKVTQYDLNNNCLVESAANDGSFDQELKIELTGGETFINPGSSLTEGVHYNVELPEGLSPDITVSGDGLFAIFTIQGNALLHQAENTLDQLVINFENSAFSSGNAAIISNASGYSEICLRFKDNPSATYAFASDEQIQLNWEASAVGFLTDYRVYRSDINGNEMVLADIPKTDDGTDTTYVDTDVFNGKYYDYRLVGIDGFGNETDLTDNGTPLTGLEGAIPNQSFGNVAVFDGDDDYIEIPDAAALRSNNGTVDFWFKIDEDPSGNAYSLVGKHEITGSRSGWHVYHDADELVANIKTGTNSYKINSGLDLVDGEWHHVAFVFEGSSNPSTLYIDGSNVGTVNAAATSITTQPVRIGKSVDSYWSHFKGAIDEVRLWDDKKTSGEISGLMNNRADGSEEGLLFVLNLDEPNGVDFTNDGSPNNFNGEIFGNVRFENRLESGEAAEMIYAAPFDFASMEKLSQAGEPIAIGGDVSIPRDIQFNPEGTRMYVIGSSADKIFQYSLTNPFDINAGITLEGSSVDFQSDEDEASAFAFSRDGEKVFILGTINDKIRQYSLSTPFDVTSGWSDDGTPLSVATEEPSPLGFNFSIDGKKLYVVGNENLTVYQYSLTNPFDITSGVALDGGTVSPPESMLYPSGLTFSSNGMKMYMVGLVTDQVYQYNLEEPFDLTAGTVEQDPNTLDISSTLAEPTGVWVNESGTRLYLVGFPDEKVAQYNFDHTVFQEPLANDGSVEGSMVISLLNETFTNSGSSLTYGDDFEIENLPEGLTPVFDVDDSGMFGTLTMTGTADVGEDSDDRDPLVFRFKNAAFSGGDAGSVLNAVEGESGLAMDFYNKSALRYSTVVDVTNPSNLSLESLNLTLPAEIEDPSGMVFSNDGLKVFLVDPDQDKVYQLGLNEAFDVTAGYNLDGSLDVTLQANTALGVAFNDNGSKMYVTGVFYDKVHQYSLSTPFDITSGVSYDGNPFDVSVQDANPHEIDFSADGTKLYMLGNTNGKIYQYSLNAPFDITGAVNYDGDPLSIIDQEAFPQDFKFSPDGKQLFVVGYTNDAISQFILNEPFDITTGVSFYGSYDLSSVDEIPTGIDFGPDQSRIFIVGAEHGRIYQFDLPGAFVENELNKGGIDGALQIDILGGETFSNAGSRLVQGEDYQIQNLPDGLTPVMDVAADGLSATLTLSGKASAHQPENDLSSLTFNFENSAFSTGFTQLVANSNSYSSGLGIRYDKNPYLIYGQKEPVWAMKSPDLSDDEPRVAGLAFSNDGMKMFITGFGNQDVNVLEYDLESPYDVSNIQLVNDLDVSAHQQGNLYGLTFSPDGRHMYLNSNSHVTHFTLSTAFDLSTASYSGQSFATGDQDPLMQGVAISDDGRRLFVVGFNTDQVYQYDLSTRWDISTASYNGQSFSVADEDEVPTDLTFSSNGEEMYILGNGNNKMYKYLLTAAFDVTTAQYTGVFFDVSNEETEPNSINLDPAGEHLFVGGSIGADVNRYDLQEEGFSEVEADNGSVEGQFRMLLNGEQFTNAGASMTYGTDYSISNLPDGITASLEVDPSKKLVVLTLFGNATNSFNDDDVENLQISFNNSAFVGGDVDFINNPSGVAGAIDFDDNFPPVFISMDEVDYDENSEQDVLDVNANNGDGGDIDEGVVYSLVADGDNEFFSIDETTGVISFNEIPDFEAPKDENADNIHEITVRADDGIYSSDQNILISITDKNDESPVFTSADAAAVPENITTVLTITTTDADAGSSVSYSLSGGSDQSLFSINENTGDLSFVSGQDFENPVDDNTDNDYVVQVTASDGTNSTDQIITVSITDENDENPVFTSADAEDIQENTSTVITVTTTDADAGSTITYSLSGGTDQSLFTIDTNTGDLSFNSPPDFEDPADANTDNDYEVQITASDGTNSTDQILVVTVTNVNEEPTVVNSLSDLDLSEGFNTQTVDLTGSFNDPDGDGLTLSASSDDETVVTVSISGNTVTLSEEGTGTANVTVTADDGNGGSVNDVFSVSVNAEANNAPTLANPINDQSFEEGFGSSDLDLSNVFVDPDGDELTLSASSDDETVVTVSISGNTLTLSEAGTGTANVTVTADDGNGGSVNDAFSVSVNAEDNNAPTLANSINDQVFEEGFGSTDLDLSAVFEDADGDALTITASSSNETVVTVSVAGSTLTITEAGNGTAQITVTANDSKGGTVSDIFKISVNAAGNNTPAVANPISDQNFEEGFGSEDLDLTDIFEDPDEDALTLSASSDNETIITVHVSGKTLTVTEVGIGIAQVTVTADDGKGGTTSDEFMVNVSEAVNEAPVITESIEDVSENVGFTAVKINLANHFTDPENDNLIFSSTSSNQTVVTSGVSGSTLTLSEVGSGTSLISVWASDGELKSDTIKFNFTINQVLGIKNEIDLTVYPNPAVTSFSFNSRPDKNTHISLYDLDGRNVKNFNLKFDQNRFDISDLKPGTYLLIVKSNDQTYKQKLIKQ